MRRHTLYLNLSAMMSLSYWAKKHILQARLLIVLLHTLGITLAFEMGVVSYVWNGRAWPLSVLVVLAAVMLGLRVFFPASVGCMLSERLYWRSRVMMGALVLTIWSFVAVSANRTAEWANMPDPISQVVPHAQVPVAYGQLPYLMTESAAVQKGKSLLKGWSTWKKRYIQKKIYRAMRNQPKNEEAAVLLTILTILVACALALLIASLSCELSCSGQESASILLLIVGGGGLIVGTIAVIASIWRKNRNNPATAPEAPPPPATPKRAPSKKW